MPVNTTSSGRPYAGESPEVRADRRREQFMDAGHQLFGTVGFRASTVRLLCREAQVTDRYFYESFANTEALLIAVYERNIEHIRQGILGALAAQPTEADLSTWVEAGLAAFFAAVEDPRVVRVCWQEILGVSHRVDRVYNEGLQSFATLILDLARDIYPDWPASDEEGHIVALALIGGVSQAALGWLLSDYQANRAVMIAATSRIILATASAIQAESQPRATADHFEPESR